MARKYHSPTSINTYLRCPRKYFLRYIKRLKEKPSIYLVRGKAVHQALAEFAGLGIGTMTGTEQMMETLMALYDEAWYKQDADIQALAMPAAELDDFHQEGALMLQGWLQRNQEKLQKGGQDSDTEVKLFSARHGVMGIIDVIKRRNGHVCVLDYKTSQRDEITPDIKVQMAIYALLHQDKFGKAPDLVAIDFLKQGKERRFKVTDTLLRHARNLCRDIHHKTASSDERDYPCTCGGWCAKDFITV